jgi:hypothetical protein
LDFEDGELSFELTIQFDAEAAGTLEGGVLDGSTLLVYTLAELGNVNASGFQFVDLVAEIQDALLAFFSGADRVAGATLGTAAARISLRRLLLRTDAFGRRS